MEAPEDLRRAAGRAREEATQLRRLAGRLDASHVHELARLSGDDTWVGPTATAFRDAVGHGRLELDAAATDLRRHAGLLELDAQELDGAARRAEATGIG